MINLYQINPQIRIEALEEAQRVNLLLQETIFHPPLGYITRLWIDPLFMYYMGHEL